MIPETLEELVDPEYTAIIVVDVQNDFCSPGGVVYGSGEKHKIYPQMIKNIKKLLDAGREAGALIAYLTYSSLPHHLSDSIEGVHERLRLNADGDVEKIPTICLEGTWGAEVVDEIKPKEKDVIVKKNRPSGFIQTNLDLILRNQGIKTLVMTGIVTEGCVLSTARHGQCLDYLIVPADGCMSSPHRDLHECAMKLMDHRFNVYGFDEIISAWEKK
jgi:nicotinamidase-related amidase